MTIIRPHAWFMIHDGDIAAMIAGHAALRQLCAALEAVADDLPAIPADEVSAHLCARLDALAAQHDDPFDRIFARLPDSACLSAAMPRLLGHAQAWRLSDAMHAQDVAEALGDLPGPPCPARSTALGYMLRCFFEGSRRAMAFRETTLLALGRGRLTPRSIERLQASLLAA